MIARMLRAALSVLLFGIFIAVLSFSSALGIVLSTQGFAATDASADCGLVFGAAVYGITPGPAVLRRMSAAADLQKQGKIRLLVLSGGKGLGSDPSEARVMRDEAMRLGVPPSAIRLEDQSRSTVQNIRLSRPLLQDCTSVVGISDGFHVARIRLLSRREGWNSLRVIAAQGRPPLRTEIRSVLREVLGYVYYAYRLDTVIDTDRLPGLAPRLLYPKNG